MTAQAASSTFSSALWSARASLSSVMWFGRETLGRRRSLSMAPSACVPTMGALNFNSWLVRWARLSLAEQAIKRRGESLSLRANISSDYATHSRHRL